MNLAVDTLAWIAKNWPHQPRGHYREKEDSMNSEVPKKEKKVKRPFNPRIEVFQAFVPPFSQVSDGVVSAPTQNAVACSACTACTACK